MILLRRSFSPLLVRLMRDRTADSIALVVSRLPDAAAIITSLAVQNWIAALAERPPAGLNPGLPATEGIDAAYEYLPGAGGKVRPRGQVKVGDSSPVMENPA